MRVLTSYYTEGTVKFPSAEFPLSIKGLALITWMKKISTDQSILGENGPLFLPQHAIEGIGPCCLFVMHIDEIKQKPLLSLQIFITQPELTYSSMDFYHCSVRVSLLDCHLIVNE